MAERRIPLDGWEDDDGDPQMFLVDQSDDLVWIELPDGHHGAVGIWPAEARALANALMENATEAETAE